MRNIFSHHRSIAAVTTNPKQAKFAACQALFWMAMTTTSFFVVFFQENNYSGTEIGIVLALVNVVSIVSQTFWGVISDRLGSIRKTLMLVMGISCLTFTTLALLGHSVLFPGFILGLILVPCCTMFYAPQSALLDTWIIDTANHEGGISYSKIRLWGSIGYAVVIFAMARIADLASARIVLLAYPIFAVMLIVLILRIGETTEKSGRVRVRFRDMPFKELFKNYYYITYIPFTILIHSQFSLSGSYLSYLLKDVGASINGVGTLAGLRAVFEVPALMLCPYIIRKFGRPASLMFASALHLISQTGYHFAGSLPVILCFQAIGGFAGGLLIGCGVSYIYQVSTKELIATAQTFAGAMSSLCAVFFSMLGGRLLDVYGIRTLFVIAASLQAFAIVYFLATLAIGKKVLKIPFPEDEHTEAA